MSLVTLIISQLQQEYPFPTTRASAEHLNISTTIRSPLSPPPRLRSVASMGNLRSQRLPPPTESIPSMPPLSFDLFSYDPPLHPRLGHQSSQESALSQGSRFMHPTRQPHGPPQDQSRGFGSREIFSQIRPIGSGTHGNKTPSRGSLSHGSGSRESRGGSDSILDLQVPPPQEY